jgi:acyl-[acyl-carrier-protein]-phospholipid O-acyltransferase/long-chain-fatty-acid--[acyl-carrier-protein] ligase
MIKIHPFHPRFLCFLAAQFLGAFNDNAFKLVLSLASVAMFTDPNQQKTYLSVISALSILPFVLFSGYAGYLTDRYPKSRVLKLSKAVEIVAMGAALVIFIWAPHRMDLLMMTLFFTAVQATFFSPSKYGILPEWMKPEDWPKANGYLNMLTFVAIITGSLAGGVMWQVFQHNPIIIGVILTALAVIGTVLCLFAPTTTLFNPSKPFDLNPFGEIVHAWPLVKTRRSLIGALSGSAVYWMLGALIYLSLILLGTTDLGLSDAKAASLFSFLAVGIGIGSIAAGYILGKSIRKTLIVWGAVIMGLACIACGLFATGYWDTAFWITLAGLGAGLFIVPVVTLMQKESPDDQRGQVMAVNNFFDMMGVLLASGLFWLLGTQVGLSASGMITASGVIVLFGLALGVMAYPKLLQDALESLLYAVMRGIYRVTLVGPGLEKGKFPPLTRPTVIIANHVTFIDGLLISMMAPKRVHFLVLAKFWKKPLTRFCLTAAGAIPFGSGAVGETRQGLETARERLREGGVICIFPEGVLSRTGHLYPFKRGVEKLVEGLDVDILPVHLERLWGSIFSFSGRRFFKKWPKQIPYPVTVSVGQAVPAQTQAWELEHIVSELGTDAIPLRYADKDTLGGRFVTQMRRHFRDTIFSDTTGKKCTGFRALVGARLIGLWLKKNTSGGNIPILLPATVGGALVNIAAVMQGKVAVNLNFSLGAEALATALKTLSATTIITSRTFIEKANIAPDDRMVFLEDMPATLSKLGKLVSLLQVALFPTFLLKSLWVRGHKNDTAVLLFSSGSTGTPKAVALSHQNIIANIESIGVLLEQAEGESETKTELTLMGILPFFHSFGLTACLWLPAITGRRVVYHPSPLDAKTVVRTIHKEKCGLIVATPTFVRTYTTTAKEGELASLKLVIVGGEKLTAETAEKLAAALPQAHVLEGYGTTELGPVVSVNVPDIQHGGLQHKGTRLGSVGKPIPGVSVRILDLESDTILPPDQEGRIFIKSPSQMQGYYNDPDRTASVMKDGWYDTGDIGKLDPDGFLIITDRLSRFSKMGGEMVPHGKIEEEIHAVLGDHQAVVVSLPDASKGERLGVLFVSETLTPETLYEALKKTGRLPNLWLPRPDAMVKTDTIPLLSTGKMDLRTARGMVVAGG